MQKVLAYGPEILALEDHFDGQTIILDGYQRYFISINDTLYCNFKEEPNTWMAARLYEITDDELQTFKSVYPDEYKQTAIEIEEDTVRPFVQTAITFIGTNSPVRKPLTEPTNSAYTLFENLSIAISEVFASKFALSTHSELEGSKQETYTSYYRYLEEIDLTICRKKVLSLSPD